MSAPVVLRRAAPGEYEVYRGRTCLGLVYRWSCHAWQYSHVDDSQYPGRPDVRTRALAVAALVAACEGAR